MHGTDSLGEGLRIDVGMETSRLRIVAVKRATSARMGGATGRPDLLASRCAGGDSPGRPVLERTCPLSKALARLRGQHTKADHQATRRTGRTTQSRAWELAMYMIVFFFEGGHRQGVQAPYARCPAGLSIRRTLAIESRADYPLRADEYSKHVQFARMGALGGQARSGMQPKRVS